MSETHGFELGALLADTDFTRRLARSLVRDASTADDLSQEALGAAVYRPPRDAGRPRAWLAGVIRRLAARHFRDRANRERRERIAARPEATSPVAVLAEREETRRRVVAAVLTLEEPYRETVVLRYFEDLPPRGVAHRQGVPVETVRTRLKRALPMLRARLEHDHRGDRRALTLALLPLAGLSGRGAASATGAMLMTAKAKILLAAGFLLLVGVAVVWRNSAPEPLSPPVPAPESSTPVARAPSSPTELPPAGPGAAVEHLVRGLVVDQDGRPVSGTTVAILSEEDPFDGRSSFKYQGLSGRQLSTGEDGTFEARFAGPRRVRIVPGPGHDPAFAPDPGQDRWVDTPSDAIRLTGVRWPVATVVVRVTDLATGKRLDRFRCSLEVAGGFHMVGSAGEGIQESVVRLPQDTRESTVSVTLVEPARPEPVTLEVGLREGERKDVELSFRSTVTIRGTVRDAEGHPVEGALVFFGNQIRARGDEPFKPFRSERITDGVRSGPDGAFELRGDGREATVWHERLSPVTVRPDHAVDVVLPPRGSIRGRLVEEDGRPVEGAEVVMDRTRKATTDADGAFEFEGVEAGARGLFLPGGRIRGIRIEPGQTAQAVFDRGVPRVRLALRAGGEPFRLAEGAREVLLLGLGKCFPCVVVKGDAGADSIVFEGVPPGRYVLMLHPGPVAVLDVDGPEATADFGTAELAVAGTAGTRVYVLPQECADDELSRLMAGRVLSRAISESGEAVFSPLPAGTYRVGVDRMGLRGPAVELAGAGARVAITE